MTSPKFRLGNRRPYGYLRSPTLLRLRGCVRGVSIGLEAGTAGHSHYGWRSFRWEMNGRPLICFHFSSAGCTFDAHWCVFIFLLAVVRSLRVHCSIGVGSMYDCAQHAHASCITILLYKNFHMSERVEWVQYRGPTRACEELYASWVGLLRCAQ